MIKRAARHRIGGFPTLRGFRGRKRMVSERAAKAATSKEKFLDLLKTAKAPARGTAAGVSASWFRGRAELARAE